MNRFFIRFIALLVVPCFFTDPALAFGFDHPQILNSTASYSNGHHPQECFEAQALIEKLMLVRHYFGDRHDNARIEHQISPRRHTMPARTKRPGYPGPAMFYSSDQENILSKALKLGRIVYMVPAKIANKFDSKVLWNDPNMYSLRKDMTTGKIIATMHANDKFLRIAMMDISEQLGIWNWGKKLPSDELARLKTGFDEALAAHKANLVGVKPNIVGDILHGPYRSLRVEIRESHDVYGEEGRSNLTGPLYDETILIIDRELLKKENYERLIMTLIAELGHPITGKGDASTENSIRVYAMRLYDKFRSQQSWQTLLTSKSSPLLETMTFFGLTETEYFKIVGKVIVPRVGSLIKSLGERELFGLLVTKISARVADILLMKRGPAKMPDTGEDRHTMPSDRWFGSGGAA